MSTVDPLGSAAAQLAHARLDDAERYRLARSIRRQRSRNPRRSAATVLRAWADRIEPDTACLDC
jgi:hypothetical protein